MAECITLAFVVSVWAVSGAFGWLVRTHAPTAARQADHIAAAGLATAALGGGALWLAFTISGVTAAG